MATEVALFEYDNASESISNEALRARKLFPDFNSAHEGYAVLLEEVDELWDEVKAHDPDIDRQIAEAVQVGAMATRFVAMCLAKKRAAR